VRALLAAFLVWLATAAGLAAQTAPAAEIGPSGFWLVAETGPPVSQGLAALPLFGAAVRNRIGNPRAIWDVRRDGNNYDIDILPRGIAFRNVAFVDGRLAGEAADPDNPQARVRLDVAVGDGSLKGRLVFADFVIEIDGRLPESVETLRQAHAAVRTRLDELEGPYAIAEIEKLRLENIVLIERINRIENELRQGGRNSAPPAAASQLRIAARSLAPDWAIARTTVLRAAPDANAAALGQLGQGAGVQRIGEAPAAGWTLVADSRGVLGYVQTAQLAPRIQPTSTAGATATARGITISFPAWDQGRTGQRMTVAEPGYVSLVGRVRGDGMLREIRIADAQTVSNPDGSFTAVLPVPREGRRVRIEAAFSSGPVAVSEFEIAVGR
jgi:hypothetical protein